MLNILVTLLIVAVMLGAIYMLVTQIPGLQPVKTFILMIAIAAVLIYMLMLLFGAARPMAL